MNMHLTCCPTDIYEHVPVLHWVKEVKGLGFSYVTHHANLTRVDL